MKFKCSYLILIFFFILSCNNSKEEEIYKIYNTVLQEKVSTYGIMVNYFHYDKDYSEKEREIFAEKIKDSLIKSKSLTYYLDNNLVILDTLNPSDLISTGKDDNLIFEFKPEYSKNKIDFSKIKKLEIGTRISEQQEIDENKKNPTYLGYYELSEPIFISKEEAVIKYSHNCGSKCGLVILIYLKKQEDEWKITNEKLISIS